MKKLLKGAAIALLLHIAAQAVPARAVTLQWLGYREISLYGAPSAAGPWSLIGTNLVSPYTFDSSNGQMYFKAICTAEFVTLQLPASSAQGPYTFVYRCSPQTGMTNIYFTTGTPQKLQFLETTPGTNVYAVYAGNANKSALNLLGSGAMGNGVGQGVTLTIH